MAAQRVRGSWLMVHSKNRTVNRELLTIDKRQRRSGFSLIELMVVITLFTITTIAVTTSYISFQGREILKNAALQLKSDLRLAQNSAQTGDKASNDAVGCASFSGSPSTVSSTVLGGWYMLIPYGGTSYTIAGDCLTPSPVPPASPTSYTETSFGFKTVNLQNGVNVSAITCGSTSLNTDGDVLGVLFMPLTNSVSSFKITSASPANFFDDPTGVLNSGCLSVNGENVITLNSSDGSYEIHITQSGQINEEKI